MSVRLPALAFGALVLGSVIVVDPGGLAPFGPSKWLVVSTLACTTTALSLRSGSTRCHRRSWWMWVALLALLTLSALANGDAKVALLGHPDRHLGVVTWVLLFADMQEFYDQQATYQPRTVVQHSTDGINWSRDDVSPIVGFDSFGATRVQVTDSNVLISMVDSNTRDAEGTPKAVVLVGTPKS